jgi:hypothetical protein
MTKRRSHGAKKFVFGELRTALVALRGLHRKAKWGERTGGQWIGFRVPTKRPTAIFPPSITWAGLRTPEEGRSLNCFVIAEDPHHLEETVLIGMDSESMFDVEASTLTADTHPGRFEYHGPEREEIQRATTWLDPPHEVS